MSDEKPLSQILSPEKALIFRITHRDNLAWLLGHGLHCANSEVRDPDFVSIGKADLIQARGSKTVPVPPGGDLSEYVPFYFTPRSPMLLNILTGRNGVLQRDPQDILVVVSSLHELARRQIPFVFTDRHAYSALAVFASDLADLSSLRWPLLQASDFRRDEEDPGKVECYQAEALVHRHLPVEALQGVACYNHDVRQAVERTIVQAGVSVKAVTRRGWYFS